MRPLASFREALEGRFVRFDDPVRYPDNSFGRLGDVLVVGHENDGNPFFLIELFKYAQDFLAGSGVEVAGGFIGEEQGGVVDQGPGDGDTLLLSAGELRGFMVEMLP